MSVTETADRLLMRARRGEVAATSQLITALESRRAAVVGCLPELFASGGRAHVVGVTGPPGSGKSTLVAALAAELRDRERTVGIIAVDPSSALSGGAILGDRIRMQRHTLDPGIFLRSMSTRGRLGGVARATVDAVAVLDAAGYDVVVVETVGVGQAEVEIVQIAHTTVVVSVPGLGDDIQAIKAGLLEVADLHVVNKADRPGADRTRAELLAMLTLSRTHGSETGWSPPVIGTSALDGTGVGELADALDGHLGWLRSSGELERRERAAAAARIRAIARDFVTERMQDPAGAAGFAQVLDRVAARRLDPHTAARELVERAVRLDSDMETTT